MEHAGASTEIITEFLSLRARIAELEKEKEEQRASFEKEKEEQRADFEKRLREKDDTIKFLIQEKSLWMREYSSASQKLKTALAREAAVAYRQPPTRDLPPQANLVTTDANLPHEPSPPSTYVTTINCDNDEVMKCKNVLVFLLEHSKKQNDKVAETVRNLVQDVIDYRITATAFDEKLATTLNSEQKPTLVTLLKKTLPRLRHYLMKGEISMPGIWISVPPAPAYLNPRTFAQLKPSAPPLEL